MELYHLQSLIAVAHTGSLSKAATARNISLSGISKHIKMLEEELCFPLFIRKAKGMELTEKGRLVLIHAKRIEQTVNDLNALSRQAPPMRIGLNISPDFIELFHLKKLLARHHPHKETVLASQNSADLLKKLGDGDLDVCLAFGRVPDHLHRLLVRNVRMPLMIPANLPGESLQLDRECWIINTAGCPFKPPLEEFWRVHAIHPQSTILAQDLTRKEIVAQGLGIGFLEPQDGLALMKTGLAKKHRHHFLQISLSVVFLDNRFASTAELIQRYLQMRYEQLDLDIESVEEVSDEEPQRRGAAMAG
jgi:DNA-binding transcriptional LysR family regulator